MTNRDQMKSPTKGQQNASKGSLWEKQVSFSPPTLFFLRLALTWRTFCQSPDFNPEAMLNSADIEIHP